VNDANGFDQRPLAAADGSDRPTTIDHGNTGNAPGLFFATFFFFFQTVERVYSLTRLREIQWNLGRARTIHGFCSSRTEWMRSSDHDAHLKQNKLRVLTGFSPQGRARIKKKKVKIDHYFSAI
jgi:hypothetical protein